MSHILYANPYTRFDETKGQITIATWPVIVSKDGERVLLHTSTETQKWQFIGGRLHDDESIRSNALARAREVVGDTVVQLLDLPPLVILDTLERKWVMEDILLMHFKAEIEDESRIGSAAWYTLPEVQDLHDTGQTSSPNVLVATKEFLRF